MINHNSNHSFPTKEQCKKSYQQDYFNLNVKGKYPIEVCPLLTNEVTSLAY